MHALPSEVACFLRCQLRKPERVSIDDNRIVLCEGQTNDVPCICNDDLPATRRSHCLRHACETQIHVLNDGNEAVHQQVCTVCKVPVVTHIDSRLCIAYEFEAAIRFNTLKSKPADPCVCKEGSRTCMSCDWELKTTEFGGSL